MLMQADGEKKEEREPENTSRMESLFHRFLKNIARRRVKKISVSKYAEELCITPKYLSETVKAVSKRTPNEWIDNYVTLEMRVLLKNSAKTIKEITAELNFPNQSFFGRWFKAQTGISPKAYRNSK